MSEITRYEALSAALETPSATTYLRYHAPRYAQLITHMTPHVDDSTHILDIGLSPFASILAAQFGVPIDTLGLQQDHRREQGEHYQLDLNGVANPEQQRRFTQAYDIIVYAEVLEHLYTPPDLVLKYLRTLLTDTGLIFIQTPNAVVLHKRLRMLAGHNPYALLVDQPDNPAHFREYTAAELAGYCEQSRFTLIHRAFTNYFDYRYPAWTSPDKPVKHRQWLNHLYNLLPGSLRPGLFFIAQPDVAESNPLGR